MADPYVILAPIVEPLLPPPQALAPAPMLLPWALAAVALAVLALAAWALWRRGAAARALRRIARHADAQAAAQQLARWQQRHWPQAPQDWQQALERLRFAAVAPTAGETLRQLCAQAGQRPRAGRSR